MATAHVLAIDYGDRGIAPLENVVSRLRDAGASPVLSIDVPTLAPTRRDGTVPRAFMVSFDGDRVRDTWVHGWACNAGYVVSITDGAPCVVA